MTALAELQQAFVDWLLHGDQRIRPLISSTGRADTDTRLNIYANAYRLRLLEALQDTFPALHTLLGDERFQQLGSSYVDNSPSENFSIRYFGHRFADFLKRAQPYCDNPLLAEMAAFEWALRDAFDATDDPAISAEEIKSIPPAHWADMRIGLHASVRRLDLGWNVPQLWQAIDQDAKAVEPEPVDPPISWLIWRQELKTLFRSLDVDEARLVDGCLQHETFAELCTNLCEWVDEQHAAPRAVTFLTRWCESGLISRII